MNTQTIEVKTAEQKKVDEKTAAEAKADLLKKEIAKQKRLQTVNLKNLYKKYEAETVQRKAKNKDKKYNASDIRQNVDKIFTTLSVDKMSMSILHKLLIEVDDKFKELRYQEVRSVILSKKFGQYQLKTINEVSTAVKV